MNCRVLRSADDVSFATAQSLDSAFFAFVEQAHSPQRAGESPDGGSGVGREFAWEQGATSRELEYRFACASFAALETEATHLRVLDVGCGLSPFCNFLSHRGHEVSAVDSSGEVIELLLRADTNARYGSAVTYRGANYEDLPFADASFDVVTCLSVIADMPQGNDRLAIRQIARVLRPGGTAIFTLPIAASPHLRVRQWGLPARRQRGQPFSVRMVRSLVEDMRASFAVATADPPYELLALRGEAILAASVSRLAVIPALTTAEIGTYLLEGQQVLEEQLAQVRASSSPATETGGDQREVLPAKEGTTPLGELPAHLEGAPGPGVSRSSDQPALAASIAVLEREKELAEAVAEARLQIIEQQRQALVLYRQTRLRERVRRRVAGLTAPRIGVLEQYPPRPMNIPSWYAKVPPVGNPVSISIVTATLNQGQFIEYTLESVLSQNYPALEYIVQDGGSGDGTLGILSRFDASLAHVASERDRGFGDAINRGFAFAHGDIMAYLNSDDLLLSGSLNYIASYFRGHPEVDVVYGHRVVIDQQQGEIGRWVLPAHNDDVLSWADYIPQETLFWRRSIWEKIGGYIDESFRFAIDWDLLLRFRDAGATMRRLPRFLGAFRVHPNQKTSAEMVAVGASEMERLRRRALGRAVTTDEIMRALAPYLRRHFVLHKLYRLGVLRY